MMKISIITPVYKAELFVSRLIDSVLAQTYKDFELILVDDGSPDKSGTICDNYAAKDARIKVIHKKNGGVSSARQAGLDAATGEYVIHADSDDWVAPNWLEELVKCASTIHAEMIVFDFYRVQNDKKRLIKQEPTSLQSRQVLRDIISGHLYACCWNKLISRKSIKYNCASFPINLNFGEDKCFLVSLLTKPISIAYVPKALYFYDVTMNNESLVRQITISSMNDGFFMVDFLEKELGSDYNREIYEIKRRLKLRAIESRLYSNLEVNKIYKNINRQLLEDVIFLRRRKIDDYVLFFTTINAMRVARLLDDFYHFLYRIKTRLFTKKT